MILQDLKNKLETLDLPVFYGRVSNVTNLEVYDYIVFLRDYTKYSATKKSFGDYFTVVIVSEEFIEEDFDKQVIDAVTSLAGFRVTDDDISYEYTTKPNTDILIELATIKFVHARK